MATNTTPLSLTLQETAGFDSKSAPRFSTDDLIDGTNDQSFQNFLLKTPQDLVKFKIFKRSLEDAQFKKIYIDKRCVLLLV